MRRPPNEPRTPRQLGPYSPIFPNSLLKTEGHSDRIVSLPGHFDERPSLLVPAPVLSFEPSGKSPSILQVTANARQRSRWLRESLRQGLKDFDNPSTPLRGATEGRIPCHSLSTCQKSPITSPLVSNVPGIEQMIGRHRARRWGQVRNPGV